MDAGVVRVDWRQVIEKFRSGDQDAYCIVYQRYFDDVYNFVCYSVGHSNAEDVVQETFLRVYRSSTQFRGDSELRTWIFGIARRQISDWFRRQRLLPANWLGEVIPDLTPGPEESFYIQEQAREVLAKLEKLGFKQRSVVVLRSMYGFSGREVAEIMGMSESNVRTLLHRTIKKLQSDIRPEQWGVSG